MNSYWHFDYLNFEERGLYFALYDDVMREHSFDLIFEWSVNGNDIIVELVDLKDKGPCHVFPSADPNPDKRCTSDGSIFIPEDIIPPGDYNFIIRSESLNVASKLNFDGIKYSLSPPDENLFSIHKKEIYPLPKNILLGKLEYRGDENTQTAKDFVSELNSLGFLNIVVPNFNKIGINEVDSIGLPYIFSWSPDYHSRNFVCSMSDNFKLPFDLAYKYYKENPKIDIVLRSSNGDSADFSQIYGVSFKFK